MHEPSRVLFHVCCSGYVDTNQLGDADLIVNFCHHEVKSEKLQVTRSSLPKPGVPRVEVSAINTFNCSLEFPVLPEPTLSQK